MTIPHLVIMNISKNSGYLCVNHIFIYIFVISSSVMAKRPKKIDEWICSAQKETGDTRGLKKTQIWGAVKELKALIGTTEYI